MTVHPASRNDPMETIKYYMFGKICACIAIFANIGKYNSPSIVDLIICPLGQFELIIFVVVLTLFRWEDTDIKFTVHTE